MDQRSFTGQSVYSDTFHKPALCLLFLINIPSTLTLFWTTDTQMMKRVGFFFV